VRGCTIVTGSDTGTRNSGRIALQTAYKQPQKYNRAGSFKYNISTACTRTYKTLNGYKQSPIAGGTKGTKWPY